MYRQSLRILTALITGLAAFAASAQTVAGSWMSLPLKGATFDKIIDTPAKTYFLTDGSLMSLADDGENYFYSTQNKLSDNQITDIYYNYDKGYLLALYQNGNIDAIYDDGHVVNMPDIKEAILPYSKKINHVAFGADRFVVSTSFGIVVFNDERHEVVESGIYGSNVPFSMILGDRLLIVNNNTLYTSALADRHPRLDRFVRADPSYSAYYGAVAKLSETSFVFQHQANKNLVKMDYDAANGTYTGTKIADGAAGTLTQGDGKAFVVGTAQIIAIASDGSLVHTNYPDALKTGAVFSNTGTGSVWHTPDQMALWRYDISGTTPTVLLEDYTPEAMTTRYAIQQSWSADGQSLYVANMSSSLLRQQVLPQGLQHTQVPLTADRVFVNGSVDDVSPLNAYGSMSSFTAWQKATKTTRIVGSIANMAADPNNSDRYFLATQTQGLYSILNGEIEILFSADNSPLPLNWGTSVNGVGFDNEGNLWVSAFSGQTLHRYFILESKYLKGSLANLPASAWKNVTSLLLDSYGYDQSMLFCKKSNIAFFTAYGKGVYVLNTGGTPADFSDDSGLNVEEILDINGNPVTNNAMVCMVEDHDGHVWFGTCSGVLTALNPAEALSPTFRFSRPLVPRNDGTNFGDYLLETDYITCMAVDHSNRKWIGTEASGLYLVNADGTQILEHFTTDNSPLPTDKVCSVSVDPNSSKVYVGTEAGIMIYNSDSSPAADDYSEVYAYPNPVRPDYTGWITITGLMDNSLVKIVDAAGNLVYQGRSEGGSLVWDGCNTTGRRVRSGVYFIMASQNATGSASGSVAKIMFIN